MPDVTTAGTFNGTDPGFSFLMPTDDLRYLLFNGTSLGDETKVQYKNDAGNFVDHTNSVVTTIGDDVEIALKEELQIISTGTPNYNVTGTTVRRK